MEPPAPRPVALTIAGSDSGGGAGMQMDLRVFARLGVFGAGALTAITAQNLEGVREALVLEPLLVRAQIDAVRSGFDVRAVKTGMLGSRALVLAVAEALASGGPAPVVDPVMVATSGARLLDEDAVAAYREALLPRAALATPNLDEAAVLLGAGPIDVLGMRAAAEELFERLGCPVLLKGGHLAGNPIDVLRHGQGLSAWRHGRIEGVDTHGSGCLLSAAITAFLARGADLVDACEQALAFAHDALARPLRLAGGARLANVEAAQPDRTHLERLA